MDQDDLLEMFYSIDKDKSGCITVAELRDFMKERKFEDQFLKVSTEQWYMSQKNYNRVW